MPAMFTASTASVSAPHRLSLDALEFWIWESADILRDSIDSNDFKNYVFCLLFLDRVNDVFGERVLGRFGGNTPKCC